MTAPKRQEPHWLGRLGASKAGSCPSWSFVFPSIQLVSETLPGARQRLPGCPLPFPETFQDVSVPVGSYQRATVPMRVWACVCSHTHVPKCPLGTNGRSQTAARTQTVTCGTDLLGEATEEKLRDGELGKGMRQKRGRAPGVPTSQGETLEGAQIHSLHRDLVVP